MRKRNKTYYFLFIIACLSITQTTAQKQGVSITLTLEQAIQAAADSSLNAFVAQNSYLANYWNYRSYKASLLPSLSFNSTPIQYNQNFVKRYNSQNNTDIYLPQKSLYVAGKAMIQQNLALTGGTFYAETGLDYLHNFGSYKSTQFSSVPFRIGYTQSLLGYNSFKWNKKTEPLKYEKAKKELIYNYETISETTTSYFFSLALNQVIYNMALQNAMRSDTVYQIGMERNKIGKISQADLLTLRLNTINTQNTLNNAKINLDKASLLFASFLRYNTGTLFNLVLPEECPNIIISPQEALNQAKQNNPKMQELALQILYARQNLDQVKKTTRFSASLSASVGFNQAGNNLVEAYNDLLRQDMVSVSFNIPIIDWGVNKGKVNMAKSNLNTTIISSEQAEEAFEQEVFLLAKEFNTRYAQIISAAEAKKVAEMAYNASYQRFLIGKIDVDGLNMAENRRDNAQQAYINALYSYWDNYYKLRRYTLYDFVSRQPIGIKPNTTSVIK